MERRTPFREGPGRLPGAPLRTPSFDEALERLVAGDLDMGRYLRNRLTGRLAPLLGALRRDSVGNHAPTSTAITIAIHRVEEDPAGAATRLDGGWTPIEFAAYAVLEGLRAIDRPIVWPRTLPLTPAQALCVVLLTMDGLDAGAVCRLLDVDEEEVGAAHRGGLVAFDLGNPVQVVCPTWPVVARMESSEGEDHGDGLVHATRCELCASGRDRLALRRAAIALEAPGLAGTGLGRAALWARRYA